MPSRPYRSGRTGSRDGIELMKSILDIAEVPVIFLSAYGRDEIIARAFGAGATDYMVKPSSSTDLVARVRGALRQVTLAGRPVELTAKEYGTLAELSTNAGHVLTFETLLRRVWRLDADADVCPMRTTISSIRRKLGDDAENPTYIFTKLRVGYRMPKGEG